VFCVDEKAVVMLLDDGELAVPQRDWQLRPHQKRLWNYLMRGGKRAVAVWHRRAGKDEIAMHATAVAMLERPGNYWHCLPEYSSGRKAIFDAVNPHTGRRRIDECFPHEMRAGIREHDMWIKAVNGSTWQVVGSDSVTSGGGIGSSTAGIVFSEWSLANPSAWAYYRPILEENNGWACWISTPRGRNHLLSTYQHAQRTRGWFAELLTVDDTDALTPEAVAETIAEYTSLYGADAGRAMVEQELYCSFTAAVLGAFYAIEMRDVRNEGRILDVEADDDRAVHTCWDLGVGDDTSIWWWQNHGSQLVLLDHYAASGHGLEHYLEQIEKRERMHGWKRGSAYVPHDAKVKEWGSGRTRVETMSSLGLKPVLVPLATIDDGINAVRRTLPLCVFHPRCEDGGISALEQYRREWDDDKKCFKPTPLHDWSSNPADAFRYLSQSWRPAPRPVIKPPKQEGWHIPPPNEQRRRGVVL
jgi:phage terminase large subunit